MATVNLALSPTAVRPLKFKLLWLVVGLTAALIPLLLIWSYLGSHFAGGDGKMHQTLVETYLRFAQWGATVTRDPLEGNWNFGMPINVWLNPAIIPFSFLPADQAKIWTGVICYVLYAASWYFVLRSVGTPPIRSVVISQLAFAAFDPFYFVFGWTANFALRPWISIILVLSFIVAGLLLRIDNLRVGTVLGNTIGIAVIVMYGIALDPLWALLILTITAIPLAVVACERGIKVATAARWLVLLLALAIVYAAGPGRFLIAMSTDTSRYLEPVLNNYGQVPDVVSSIFQYPQAKYVYTFLIAGWALGFAFARGRMRLLPIVAAIAFAVEVAFSVFFLFVDVRWIIPIPLYYQMAFTGWYTLGAGIGYAALLTAGGGWLSADRHVQRMLKLPTSGIAPALKSLICLALVPGYITYTWVHVEPLKALFEPWSPPGIVEFLARRLSLVPDSRFRGAAVITREDYIGSLTQDSLLRAYIPTLNDYSEFVTEQMLVMLHELLVKGSPQRVQSRLPLFVSLAPDWAKSYVKVTGALGAKFVLSRQQLDFSSAIPAGAPSLTEKQFPVGWESGSWYVYELPRTNTGDYSPTVVSKYATAPAMLEKMASPDFNFRKDVVLTQELGETLVPLKDITMSFGRDAVRLHGSSDATSLALLPLQYSHCLRISDPNAKLVRADLALVGVVFKGQLDVRITDDFGLFTPGCRAADDADIKQMKIAIPRAALPPDTGQRPTAIRTTANIVPSVMAVVHQIK